MVAVNDEELKNLKVLVPIIRRVMPTVIANELVGVQPMTGPVASLKIGVDDRNNVRLRYWVERVTWNQNENKEWCIETYGDDPERWYCRGSCFYFRDERDRTMFILRWS
jgi:hypothetical protein